MKIVNMHEAKTHLSRLAREAHEGQETIIARAGKPCARLVPLESTSTVPMGFLEGAVPDSFFDPLPESELSAWEGGA